MITVETAAVIGKFDAQVFYFGSAASAAKFLRYVGLSPFDVEIRNCPLRVVAEICRLYETGAKYTIDELCLVNETCAYLF